MMLCHCSFILAAMQCRNESTLYRDFLKIERMRFFTESMILSTVVNSNTFIEISVQSTLINLKR